MKIPLSISLLLTLLSATLALSAPCVNFTDRTIEAGVPGAGVGNGIAFGDYDNDGDLDLYVSADPHDILYRNNGDGIFEDVTAVAGISVPGDGVAAAFGDYNNDGNLDLYIAVNDGWDILFRNEGGGRFRDVSWEVNVSNPRRARSATFADFDNDSFLDIYVVNEGAANILYRNIRGTLFDDVADAMGVADQGPGRCSAWGDYDNDGDLDIYVTNKNAPNIMYRNDNGSFKNITEKAGVEGIGDSTGVAAADYDNDGNLDIYVDGDPQNYLYHNNGDGTFTDVAADAGVTHSGQESTPAFGDYDNDGDLDLYLTVWKGKAVLYSNNGDGTFADVTEAAGLGALGDGWGGVFSDYDGDGDLDIYASYTTRFNILYQNNGSDNNWLHIKPLGSLSNKNGIGTWVELTAGGVLQVREVSGGSGYGSQASFTVEFGLGKNAVADVVEIKWPSGEVTKLTNVQVNQLIVVEEGFWAVEKSDPEYSVPKTCCEKITSESRLLPNYPNPFNPETWIPYRLANQSDVTINIYDLSGQLVRTLYLGLKRPGDHISKDKAAYWDGMNNNGESAAAGVYFYQINAGEFIQVRKMTLGR